MLGYVNGALHVVGLIVCRTACSSYAPILWKSRCTVERGLIVAHCFGNFIGISVEGNVTFPLTVVSGWSPVAPAFNDVILHERVSCPAVYAHIGVPARGVLYVVSEDDVSESLVVLFLTVEILTHTSQEVFNIAP